MRTIGARTMASGHSRFRISSAVPVFSAIRLSTGASSAIVNFSQGATRCISAIARGRLSGATASMAVAAVAMISDGSTTATVQSGSLNR